MEFIQNIGIEAGVILSIASIVGIIVKGLTRFNRHDEKIGEMEKKMDLHFTTCPIQTDKYTESREKIKVLEINYLNLKEDLSDIKLDLKDIKNYIMGGK